MLRTLEPTLARFSATSVRISALVSWMSASRRLIPLPMSSVESWPVTFWIEAPMSLIFAIASSRLGGVVPMSTASSGSGAAPGGPGTSSTYFSPSRPRLAIRAVVPTVSGICRSSSMVTLARLPSRPRPSTWPTRTPAMRTEALSSSPATELKTACRCCPFLPKGFRSSIFQIRTAQDDEAQGREDPDFDQ